MPPLFIRIDSLMVQDIKAIRKWMDIGWTTALICVRNMLQELWYCTPGRTPGGEVQVAKAVQISVHLKCHIVSQAAPSRSMSPLEFQERKKTCAKFRWKTRHCPARFHNQDELVPSFPECERRGRAGSS